MMNGLSKRSANGLLLFLGELAFFLAFRENYSNSFYQFLPILMLLELAYLPIFSNEFIWIKNFHPNAILETRLRYMPAALGVFAFVAIGVKSVAPRYIFVIGIVSSIFCAVGKILTIRFIKNLRAKV